MSKVNIQSNFLFLSNEHFGIIPILTSLICYNIQLKENFGWMFRTLPPLYASLTPNVSIYEYFLDAYSM